MASYDYDLIVLGGGAAGLTASGIGANLGAKTLMVERAKLGGDCTWAGCIPSKTLLKAAKVAHHIREAGRYGLIDQEVQLDVGRVMAHVRQVREHVYQEADAPELYEAMGIDVRFGEARFYSPHQIEVTDEDGQAERLSARYVIVATGGRAAAPPIDGLADVPHLTNETLFELEAAPEHLAIIGGGPIGTEMAQAFRRLGVAVTVIEKGDQILRKDDPELAGLLRERLEAEGVQYLFGVTVDRVRDDAGQLVITASDDAGTERVVTADALLVAVGRTPNVEALNLEAAGVAYTTRGITVDDRCRTSQHHIFAVGDVTGRYQFTHMSEHMAKIAATNAIVKLPSTIDTEHVPWVTYTDPELAHVGATQDGLDEAGESYEIYRFPYDKIDRAIAEGETTGLIKVYATSLTGKILGVSILGASAGELISEYALAMRNGITLRQMADTIHPYPSYGLGARRAADQWYARKQSTAVTRFVQTLFGYRGPVIEPDPDRIV